MKKAYIVVMDFCSGCIKTYEHDFPEGTQNDEVEGWLEEKTENKNDQCYYMWKWEPIEIIEGDVND